MHRHQEYKEKSDQNFLKKETNRYIWERLKMTRSVHLSECENGKIINNRDEYNLDFLQTFFLNSLIIRFVSYFIENIFLLTHSFIKKQVLSD